ncbi:MAG: GNAT family N-acetyltransferase [Rhodospirillales bacterium]|nr:MAG: GNAT family N-acetyltransferase [Rhodospirillales bacterium]
MAPAPVAMRAAKRHELAAIQDIESAADTVFRCAAMPWVLAMPPADLEILETARRRGHLRVAVDRADTPIGFALLSTLGGEAFLHQLSVVPRHAGRGVGGALLEAACAIARDEGRASVALSTALGVPWNAPFYARRGFVVVPPRDYTAAMRRERAHEMRMGHPAWRRCFMRRALDAAGAPNPGASAL